MEGKLAENIRALRKEKRMTQEQLAECLDVTVGAVSKWESGATTPDLSMIMELAHFFAVSVDALLGYQWQNSSLEQTLERLRKLFKIGVNFSAETRNIEKWIVEEK